MSTWQANSPISIGTIFIQNDLILSVNNPKKTTNHSNFKSSKINFDYRICFNFNFFVFFFHEFLKQRQLYSTSGTLLHLVSTHNTRTNGRNIFCQISSSTFFFFFFSIRGYLTGTIFSACISECHRLYQCLLYEI